MKVQDFEAILSLSHRRNFFYRQREQTGRVQEQMKQAQIKAGNALVARNKRMFPINRAFGHANRLKAS